MRTEECDLGGPSGAREENGHKFLPVFCGACRPVAWCSCLRCMTIAVPWYVLTYFYSCGLRFRACRARPRVACARMRLCKKVTAWAMFVREVVSGNRAKHAPGVRSNDVARDLGAGVDWTRQRDTRRSWLCFGWVRGGRWAGYYARYHLETVSARVC